MHIQNRKIVIKIIISNDLKNKHITVNFKNQLSDMLIYFELGNMFLLY